MRKTRTLVAAKSPRRWHQACLAVAVLASVATPNAVAADPPPPRAPARPAASAVPKPTEPPAPALRDPTEPGPDLRALLAPQAKAAELPALELKGRLMTPGQRPLALIGVGGQTIAAHEGDELQVAGKFGATELRVTAITPTEVRLEAPLLKRNFSLY